MKNKKGFVSISVIYALFFVFCLLLILILGNYINNRLNSKILKSDIKNSYYKAQSKFDNCKDDDNVCYPKLISDPTEGEVPSFENAQILCNLNEENDNFSDSYIFDYSKNPNNWVKFGVTEDGYDMYWRIIRINSDKSIRIMYDGYYKENKINESKYVHEAKIGYNSLTGRLYTTGNVSYKKSDTEFQSISNEEHGYGKCTTAGATSCTVGGNTVYNSNAKIALEKWWESKSLSGYYLGGIIVDSVFCNDRTGANGDNDAIYYYSAYRRLNNTNPEPSLACENVGDRFTETTSLGNGALSYPIGLITADEVYLSKMNYGPFITMSPSYRDSSSGHTIGVKNGGLDYMFRLTDDDGYVVSAPMYPVISLSPCIEITGEGTKDKPYIVDNLSLSANKTIIEANPPLYKNEKIDFTQAVTDDKSGLYTTNDNNGISYYFRGNGNVINNYIIFGQENGRDICWQIVRINGDSSIRLIYSGLTANNKCEETSSKIINENNVRYDDINVSLNEWWETTNLSSMFDKKYVVDSIFCNDVDYNFETTCSFNGSCTTSNAKKYSPYNRINPAVKKPTLICKPSVQHSETVNGNERYYYLSINNLQKTVQNGKLTYPVGLLNADELVFAGSLSSDTTQNHYLNVGKAYWTMSPALQVSIYGTLTENDYYLGSNGSYSYTRTTSKLGIRPVINISGALKIKGTGKVGDPYVLDMEE